MRLAFLGSPAAAVPTLEALVAAGHEIPVVITQPDRRRGRGSELLPTPVKAAALQLGLTVRHDQSAVLEAAPELGVVVAYGAMIPATTLDHVPMVNVHFSLLPRWRGAAPVERAILAGDDVTGVCVMKLERTLDTGPVYACGATDVGDKTAAELLSELSEIGAKLLIETLAHAPLPTPVDQVGEATYAKKLGPEDFQLWCDLPARQLQRVIRLGRATTTVNGRRVKIFSATVRDDDIASAPAGAVLLGEQTVSLVCAKGVLDLRQVQPEGSRLMSAWDWWLGARLDPQSTTWGRRTDAQP